MTPQSFREMAGKWQHQCWTTYDEARFPNGGDLSNYPMEEWNSLPKKQVNVENCHRCQVERLCDEWAAFVHGEKKADRLVSNETVRRRIIGERGDK